MPLCEVWTSLVTDKLRLFIAGFSECCAARYVALTEPAVKPRCGGRGVPRLEGARPLSCGQHTPGGTPKISRSGPARE